MPVKDFYLMVFREHCRNLKHLIKRYQLPDHLRGDVIYAVGRKTGPVAERYPAALYTGAGP